jgi:hypothetical protein
LRLFIGKIVINPDDGMAVAEKEASAMPAAVSVMWHSGEWADKAKMLCSGFGPEIHS